MITTIRNHLVHILLFSIVILLFFYTAPPSVYTGDSGEVTVAAAVWGYTHPPGYPLYSLLGNIWVRLFDVGSIAWRMNVFSALWGGLSVLVVYSIVRRLTKDTAASVIAGLSLAVSSAFWELSVVAEVFSLHVFLSLIFFWGAINFYFERKSKWILVSVAAFSLQIAHHHMIILWVPGVAYLFVQKRFWEVVRVRDILIMGLLLLFGVSLYAYLPLSARLSGQYYWGDPFSLQGVVDVFLRKAYGTFQITADGAEMSFSERLRYIPFYGLSVVYNYTSIGAIAAIVGLVHALRNQSSLALALLINWLVSGLVFLMYAGLVFGGLFTLGAITKFSLMSLVLISIFIGFGVAKFLEFMRPTIARQKGMLAKGFVVGLFFIIPLLQLVNHWEIHNMRNLWEGWYLAVDSFMFLPKNSVVRYVSDTAAFNPSYLQKVEGYRRDDVVQMASPFEISYIDLAKLAKNNGIETDKKDSALVALLLEEHLDEYAFYMNIQGRPPEGKVMVPEWMSKRVYNEESVPDPDITVKRARFFLDNSLFLQYHDLEKPTTGYVKDIRRVYADILNNHGQYAALVGSDDLAVELFEKANELVPHLGLGEVGLAQVERVRGNCQEALDMLDEIGKRYANLQEVAIIELSLVYGECLGDVERANRALELLKHYQQGNEVGNIVETSFSE